MFSCRMPKSRSQKTRHVRLPWLLDRLCFSRVGEPTDSTIELSEIASVNLTTGGSDGKHPCLVLLVPDQRQLAGHHHPLSHPIHHPKLVLECEMESERNRWGYYLKVVKCWYLGGGKGLIMEMKSKLDADSLVSDDQW